MKRLLIALAALLASAPAFAQQKPTTNIKDDISSLFPSSGAGAITAIQLRQVANEIADSYANKGGDAFTGNVTFPSATLNGNLSIPTNATNVVNLAGGDIGGSGKPRLLFKSATAITPPNNTLVGFGTAATWPFAYVDYQANLVSIIDPNGAGSQFNAMRTSDWITGNPYPLNMVSLTVHDNPTLSASVWGAYDALERTSTASGSNFFGREMSLHNMGASVSGDPFNVNPAGESVILRLDSGVGTGSGNPVTSALDIITNDALLNAGIKFGAGSITTVNGHVNAIQMANGQEVVWYSGAATPSGSLSVDVNSTLRLSAGSGVNIDFGPLRVGSATVINSSGGHVLAKVAVASLPTCNSGAEGTLYAVTDANSATFNAAIAGGGTNHVMAYCNGTGWTVH